MSEQQRRAGEIRHLEAQIASTKEQIAAIVARRECDEVHRGTLQRHVEVLEARKASIEALAPEVPVATTLLPDAVAPAPAAAPAPAPAKPSMMDRARALFGSK